MVILCEGPSDIGVIWKLQEIMGKEWEKRSITLIPCGGNSEILKAGIIFRGLSIPTYILFDLDVDSITTKRLLRFLGQPSEYPENFVHQTWACNELNLEETLKKCVGEEDYKRMWQEVETDLECKLSDLRKNEEAYSKFIEIVYEIGFKLEPFERIVNAMTDYYQSETRELV